MNEARVNTIVACLIFVGGGFGCSNGGGHGGHVAQSPDAGGGHGGHVAQSPDAGGGHEGHGSMLPPAVAMIQPGAWMGALPSNTLGDDNPDPRIVEVRLTAAMAETEYLPGKRVQVWAYNGTVPGPTIEANLGDEVIVHFSNQLPDATTLHWHGVRVPNAMDGVPTEATTVKPGGTFEYRFTLLDAGLFWFHPHVRSDAQVEKGLYGTLVVRDPVGSPLPSMPEDLIVLDDVLLNPTTGALEEGTNPRIEHLGREGNLALVSGLRSNLGLAVRAGESRRFRVVNAANGRYFKLALEGGSLIRIGGDGGYLTAPAEVSELLLVPGERADLVVSVPTPGATATLRALPYERAQGLGATETLDLLRLVAGPEPATTPLPLPTSLRSVAALGEPVATRQIVLGDRTEHGKMVHTINGAAFPNVPLIESRLGSVEAWNVVNETTSAHPFHLHGFFFQQSGVLEWKDTIDIPAKTTVSLLLDLAKREGAEGMWMYHCHILEHAESGMMAHVHLQ